jgi:uncharacterized protein (UPF0332 family)
MSLEQRLRSAQRRLEAAEVLINEGFEVDAMSRLYFGVLEAARALLGLQDTDPKTHKGVGMKLGEHFRHNVDTGLLTKLRQQREEVDYNLRRPSRKTVNDFLERAEEFVQQAEKVVTETG